MSRLTVLTFGGFEVHLGDRGLAEFESWRARALAAFLIAHRGRGFNRHRLAELLWPEWDPEPARRNLRQALYSLRSALEMPGRRPSVVSDGDNVRFELGDAWLDLEVFESAVAVRSGGAEPTALTEAVRLYRGDFLAGLRVGSSLELEEWVIQEQERLREGVVAALRTLVDHYLGTGGYSLGVHYARRLLAIDPLSEETHRKLMRLYALSGRRSRAVAQFEHLRELLERELGVEPLAETEALYEELRAGPVAAPPPPPRLEPVGPVVPLVGRARELGRLRTAWEAVARGRGRVTRIEGAAGCGKTRLVRTALHELGVGIRATVLLGRHFRGSSRPYAGLRQALEGAVSNEAEATARLLDEGSTDDRKVLAALGGRLRELEPNLPQADEETAKADPGELAEVLLRTLPLLGKPAAGGTPPGPVVLFLDDLESADPASLATLEELARRIEGLPVWLLLAGSFDGEAGGPGAGLLGDDDRTELQALPASAVEGISATLLGDASPGDLTDFLAGPGGGHPLLCSELVNLLWDRGTLVPREERWALTGSVAEAISDLPEVTVGSVVRARFEELPPSCRRLVTLAAVMGPRFDVSGLCAVEGEDERVIETTLRLLLERWWLRLHLSYWADSRTDRDLTLYGGYGRWGTFEFGHEEVRRTVVDLLDPERRRSLEAKIAHPAGEPGS